MFHGHKMHLVGPGARPGTHNSKRPQTKEEEGYPLTRRKRPSLSGFRVGFRGRGKPGRGTETNWKGFNLGISSEMALATGFCHYGGRVQSRQTFYGRTVPGLRARS